MTMKMRWTEEMTNENTSAVITREPSRLVKALTAIALAATVAACSTLGASGPSSRSVKGADDEIYDASGIRILDLNSQVLSQLAQYEQSSTFSNVFGDVDRAAMTVGHGDVLDISIWEAPPAVLFGSAPASAGLAGLAQTSQSTNIPQQQVGDEGVINVPFVGRVEVIGLTIPEIENAIVSRLEGRANDAQAVVRLVQNETRTVTVLGEVTTSRRIPLTARGERVLDALASSGGARQPINQSTVQIARGSEIATMDLQSVIGDPAQNVTLLPNDVVTVYHQPFSFVALGAVIRSAEIPFEGSGFSLAQALGRAGGLNDRRANIKGVFVFRLEDPVALQGLIPEDAQTTADGRVPVIYDVNLADPTSFFAMQDFAIRDEDVLYVSTAPGSDIQRFISTISSSAFSIIAISDALQTSNSN